MGKNKQPKYAIGTAVSKVFYSEEDGKERPFAGEIAEYSPLRKMYLIKYEDGDLEELDERGVGKIVVVGGKSKDEKKQNVKVVVGEKGVGGRRNNKRALLQSDSKLSAAHEQREDGVAEDYIMANNGPSKEYAGALDVEQQGVGNDDDNADNSNPYARPYGTGKRGMKRKDEGHDVIETEDMSVAKKQRVDNGVSKEDVSEGEDAEEGPGNGDDNDTSNIDGKVRDEAAAAPTVAAARASEEGKSTSPAEAAGANVSPALPTHLVINEKGQVEAQGHLVINEKGQVEEAPNLAAADAKGDFGGATSSTTARPRNAELNEAEMPSRSNEMSFEGEEEKKGVNSPVVERDVAQMRVLSPKRSCGECTNQVKVASNATTENAKEEQGEVVEVSSTAAAAGAKGDSRGVISPGAKENLSHTKQTEKAAAMEDSQLNRVDEGAKECPDKSDQLMNVTAQMVELKQQLLAVSKEKARLEMEVGSSKSTISAMKDEAKSQMTKVSNLEASVRSLTAERDGEKAQVAALSLEIEDVKQSSLSLQSEKDGLRASTMALTAERDGAKDKVAELSEEIEDKKQSLCALQSEKDDLESSLEQQKIRIASLETEKAEAMEKSSDQEPIIAELLEQNKRLLATVDSSESKISELRSEINASDSKFSALESEHKKCAGELERVTGEKKKMTSELSSKEAAVAKLDESVKQKDEEIRTLTEAKAKFTGQISELRAERDQLKAVTNEREDVAKALIDLAETGGRGEEHPAAGEGQSNIDTLASSIAEKLVDKVCFGI